MLHYIYRGDTLFVASGDPIARNTIGNVYQVFPKKSLPTMFHFLLTSSSIYYKKVGYQGVVVRLNRWID